LHPYDLSRKNSKSPRWNSPKFKPNWKKIIIKFEDSQVDVGKRIKQLWAETDSLYDISVPNG